MPSARATALTLRHRAALALTASLVVRQVRAITGRADVEDIDRWWSIEGPGLVRLVIRGFVNAATLGMRYLAQHAAIEGAAVQPVAAEVSTAQVSTSLLVTGPVAFKKHMGLTGDPGLSLRTMQTTLSGSAQRLVLAGERDTVTATIDANRSIVGWRRLTDGNPCAFCAMLASRGAVYKQDSGIRVVGRGGAPRGSREIGQEFHDHDDCSVEPLYEGEDEPDDVLALQAQWEDVTAGLSGREAIAAFRAARGDR